MGELRLSMKSSRSWAMTLGLAEKSFKTSHFQLFRSFLRDFKSFSNLKWMSSFDSRKPYKTSSAVHISFDIMRFSLIRQRSMTFGMYCQSALSSPWIKYFWFEMMSVRFKTFLWSVGNMAHISPNFSCTSFKNSRLNLCLRHLGLLDLISSIVSLTVLVVFANIR